MSKVMPVFIEDEKAINSFKKHNFSEKLLKKVEEYLTIKLGINIKFYESTDRSTFLEVETDNLDNRDIGVFSNIIKEYSLRIKIYKSDVKNICSISLYFSYKHHSGGHSGDQLYFYLIGDNKTNTLKEEKR